MTTRAPAIAQYPASAGGLITRVLECGTGDDLVVCLHGSGSRADRWAPVLPFLAAAGLHCFAIDFPGHGLAAKPLGYPYGTPAFAEMVTDFVDQLPGPSVALLGTSLGGHVAATVACARPERIRATVLIGAVGIVAISPELRPATNPITKTGLEGVRAKLEFLLSDPGRITEEWVREESRINSSPGGPEALGELGRYSAEQLEADLVGDAYAALDIPTLLCWGTDDRWVPPAVGYDTLRLFPKAPLLLLERAGHAPYFERPEPFAQEIAAFLADPTAAAPGPYSI